MQSFILGLKREAFQTHREILQNLNESLENIRDQIPEDVFNLENKDQLIGIFEGINDEVENQRHK